VAKELHRITRPDRWANRRARLALAASFATDLTSQSSRFYDEFGAPEYGTASGTGKDRYGWLGGAQRSGEALGDVMLMGVRLYSPLLGRFLQTDPVPDGNASRE
jgi:hypothetical protein